MASPPIIVTIDSSGAQRGAEDARTAIQKIIAANAALQASATNTAEAISKAEIRKQQLLDAGGKLALQAAAEIQRAADLGAAAYNKLGNAITGNSRDISFLDRLSKSFDPFIGASQRAQKELEGLLSIAQKGSAQSAQAGSMVAEAARRMNEANANLAAGFNVANETTRLTEKFAPGAAAAKQMAAEIDDLTRAVRLNVQVEGGHAAALDAIKQKYDPVAKAEKALSAERDALIRQFSPLKAAQMDYEATLVKINRAVELTGLTEAEAAVARTNASRTLDAHSKMLKDVAASHGQMQFAARQAQVQTIQLFSSIATGQPIWMALIQQGHQVADVMAATGTGFGAFGLAAKNAWALVTGPVGLAVAAAAAMAALGYAAESNAQRLGRLQLSLRGTRDDYASMAGEADKAAKILAAQTNLSTTEARLIAGAIAKSPDFSGSAQNIVNLGKDIQALALTMGVEIPEATKMMVDAFANPGKAADALIGKITGFDVPFANYLKDLQAVGRGSEAFALFLSRQRENTLGATAPLTQLQAALRALDAAFSSTSQGSRSFIDQLGTPIVNMATSFVNGLASMKRTIDEFINAIPPWMRTAIERGTTFALDAGPVTGPARALMGQNQTLFPTAGSAVQPASTPSTVAAERRVSDLKNELELTNTRIGTLTQMASGGSTGLDQTITSLTTRATELTTSLSAAVAERDKLLATAVPTPASTASGTTAAAGQIVTSQAAGMTYQINSLYKATFDGFLNDLAATGYKINSVGGYNNRNIAGTGTKSFHAQGAAVDVNPSDNPVNGGNNLPANIAEIAKKWGLGWGGNWTGGKTDPMHFSIAAAEGGSLNLQHTSITAGAPTGSEGVLTDPARQRETAINEGTAASRAASILSNQLDQNRIATETQEKSLAALEAQYKDYQKTLSEGGQVDQRYLEMNRTEAAKAKEDIQALTGARTDLLTTQQASAREAERAARLQAVEPGFSRQRETTIQQAQIEAERAGTPVDQGALARRQAADLANLTNEFNFQVAALERENSAQGRLAAAYGRGAVAVSEMTIRIKAESDARVKAGGDTAMAVKMADELEASYRRQAATQALVNAARQSAQTADASRMLAAEMNSLNMTDQQRVMYLGHLRDEMALKEQYAANPGLVPKLLAEKDALRAQQLELQTIKGNMAETASFMESSMNTIGSSLVDALDNGKSAMQTFADLNKTLVKSILNEFLKLAVINPLLNNMFPGSTPRPTAFGPGSLFDTSGGATATTTPEAAAASGATVATGGYTVEFHGGGIVGIGGVDRYVHPAYFDSAPRFHTGMSPKLAHDEFPAILQRGERVLTEKQDNRVLELVSKLTATAMGKDPKLMDSQNLSRMDHDKFFQVLSRGEEIASARKYHDGGIVGMAEGVMYGNKNPVPEKKDEQFSGTSAVGSAAASAVAIGSMIANLIKMSKAASTVGGAANSGLFGKIGSWIGDAWNSVVGGVSAGAQAAADAAGIAAANAAAIGPTSVMAGASDAALAAQVSSVEVLPSVATAIVHSGWHVGMEPPPATRFIHPPSFDTVPRFHQGLGGDEFMGILQKGERVLTTRQQDQVRAATRDEARPAGGDTFHFNLPGIKDRETAETFQRSAPHIMRQALDQQVRSKMRNG